MSVLIDYDCFDNDKAENLERFLPIAEYFSRLWNKDIVMDAPHGKFVEPYDTEGKIHIHFFSHPPTDRDATFKVDRLYGFEVPNSGMQFKSTRYGFVRRRGHDIGARFLCPQEEAQSELKDFKKVISDPEKIAVCHLGNGHIYITFDIACYPWDGDRMVFWGILEEASKLIIPSPGLLVSRSIEAHIDFRKSLIAEGLESWLEQVQEISLRPIDKELVRMHEELDRESLLYSERDEGTFAAIVRIERMRALLSAPPQDLSDEDFEREFEEIHGLEVVRGIEFDDAMEKLIVHTSPLTLTMQSGKSFQLSQYRIEINFKDPGADITSGQRFQEIFIGEEGWRSPYTHPAFGVESKKICFGSDVFDGLRKSTGDHDYPATIGILLSFLQLDDMKPGLRSNKSNRYQSGVDDDPRASEEEYVESPFYESEDARIETLQRYIAYSRKFRTIVGRSSLEGELAKYETTAGKLLKESADARRKVQSTREQLGDYEHKSGSLDCRDDLRALFAQDELSMFFVDEKIVSAVFAPGRGRGEAKHAWFPSLWIAINIDAGVAIISGNGGYIPERRTMALNIASEFGKRIKVMVAKGSVVEALRTIYEYLRGEGDKGTSMPIYSDGGS